MPLEIGPLGLWNSFRDDWFITRQATRLFFCSTILTLALIPVGFGGVDTTKMTLWVRVPLGTFALVAIPALLFLEIGMWRYWARVDNSKAYAKRLWFLFLLFGLWYGSCFYCYFVYLPQALRASGRKA